MVIEFIDLVRVWTLVYCAHTGVFVLNRFCGYQGSGHGLGQCPIIGRTVAEIQGLETQDGILLDENGMPTAEEQLRQQVIELGQSNVDRTSEVISEWIRLDVTA